MYISKVDLEQYLLRVEVLLRNKHTQKPYELNLAIDFYNAETKECWKEYAETHPDVAVVFFKGDACFKLTDDGDLEALQ